MSGGNAGKRSGTETESRAERKGLPDTSPERFRSESGRSRKAEVAAGQRTPCAGRGLTAESQRRAGYRKQSGKLATLRGRQGAGRQRAERMALEAKDFQSQAQWVLVAIPAPIIFWQYQGVQAAQAERCDRRNHFFTASGYAGLVIGQRSFGKLGNRKAARLAMALDAGLVLPERSARCVVENVSRTGCRLRISEPPRIDATVLVRIERIEALGRVKWVHGQFCGIRFDQPLPVPAFERLQWILDNAGKHQQNSLSHATAVWR